jgi:hypothetical protein
MPGPSMPFLMTTFIAAYYFLFKKLKMTLEVKEI